jgi:hypothetical protein
MPASRILEIVRQFPENGLKLLLHHPRNVRDLLALAGTDLLDQIDFARLTVDPTSYVASDYRHVASDLVLQVPLRPRPGQQRGRSVTLYILIEHQSEPDPLMVLRVLDYLVQIWKAQLRQRSQRHRRLADVRLGPILPVVLYTGMRRWDEVGRLVDLLEGGERFRALTPDYQPLFVSLPALPTAQLESAGGYLGWVLELVQRRQAQAEEFRPLLRRVVEHLERMSVSERLRWLELLSYIQALVYHDRADAEREGLRELIVASVRTDNDRREVAVMGRTIAEALRDEGRREEAVRSRQQTLLRQLRTKFGKVPKATEKIIAATDDVARLDAWLDQILAATTIAEVGIGPGA